MKYLYIILFLISITIQFLNCSTEQDSTKNDIKKEQKQVEQMSNSSSSAPEGIRKSELETLQISKSDQIRSFKITGRVIPKNTTQLFAEVPGKLRPGGILFKPGVSFAKGDILLKIESEEFRLGLEAQRSAFLNALTSIMPDMKSDFPESYPDWLSYVEQYKSGDTLAPLPEPQSNKEKYYITTYQIYNQYFTIKAQEERLSKYTITAPYAGTITQANIDVGSMISPGQPLGTIIHRYSYELEAGVNLETESQIKIGDRITFTSNDIPGTWVGTVVRKNKVIDPTTQNIPVYLQLKGKDIRAGMYLEGSYDFGKYTDVAILPSKAIKRDNSVLLLKDNTIEGRQIQPLEFQTESVVIQGLQEGDVIILNDFDYPVEGKKVIL